MEEIINEGIATGREIAAHNMHDPVVNLAVSYEVEGMVDGVLDSGRNQPFIKFYFKSGKVIIGRLTK